MAFDVDQIRKEFPILETQVNNKQLVYLDSAATALKPRSVVEKIRNHYLLETSNVHRGVHFLSDQATNAFEGVRKKVEHFINAEENEVVFTHGTTESINVVAHGFADTILKSGDEILVSELEHHSNLVPWQLVANKVGAKVKFAPVTNEGDLDLTQLETMISKKTKILAVTALSNTLGTKTPIKKIIQIAHAKNVPVLVDAAQAITNMRIDVKSWDCEYLAFSGHKLFGPTGTGVLYGKKEWLNKLPPLFGGGAMIEKVTVEGTSYLEAPFRFEAGTPHIAGVIGLGAALDFVDRVGYDEIEKHESKLLSYAIERLGRIKKVKIIGRPELRGPILSFVVDGAHHQDIGSLIDKEGVAIRTGHHCTQPLLSKLGLTGTARASFSIYTKQEDIDIFCNALEKAIRMLG